MTEKITGEAVTAEEARSLIGEGVHTGLRKSCESDAAHEVWKIIQTMPDWDAAVSYAVWGLSYMGYEIVKVDK